MGGTCFWNYDFSKSARTRGINRNRVDWPVSIIFANTATINRVKNAMCVGPDPPLNYCEVGSTMYFSLRDGASASWVWDSDKGVKNVLCPIEFSTATHMRLYTDGDDQMGFNPTYGFFVVGTTHFDHAECSTGHSWSGRTEDAENKITAALESYYDVPPYSWTFAADSIDLKNGEFGAMQGSHRKQNDGMATVIYMPA